MPLPIGDKLGPYEILAPIGKGGMGEVYRAHDSRLNRDVAIKVSNAQFTERFTREARSIAALNHTNICHLYDVGPNYLVMEYVEGPDLRGPMDFDDALPLIQQLIDGIEAAHEKNIIHRDLKPANIKITPEGVVKILDFGLAKAMEPPPSQDGNPENSPTLTIGATQAGTILGTAAYMAPEQAKGKAADKRSDIWSFGVIVYEMLTGKRLFQGESAVEILGGVLNKDPDISAAPVRAHRLLRWCLEKDRKQRLASISDARRMLDRDSTGADEPTAIAPLPSRYGRLVWPAVAGLLLLTAAALGVVLFRQMPLVAREVRLQVPVPEGLTFVPGTTASISPDSRWLAFPAAGPDEISRYYLRALDSLEVKPLPGSEGIIGDAPPPFWSYDSRFVVYGASGKLKKSEVAGTPAQTIADTGRALVQGGTWSRDGVILYANPSGNLMRVSADGGTPVPVTLLAPGETAHRWPQFLPDGRRFLYLRVSASLEKTGVYVGSLDAKSENQNMQPLLRTDRQSWWVASETSKESFLLIQRERTLLAQPFDTATPALSGTPVPVANEVGGYAGATAGLWSVARNGALAVRSGGAGLPQLTWRDLTGKTLGVVGEPDSYSTVNLAVSLDGGRVAFALTDAQGNQDVWVRDVARGKNTRLTFDPRRDEAPVWSPDGTKIIFAANRGGSMDLYEKNADGSGEERLLFKSDQDKTPTSWSRDGRFLLFQSTSQKTAQDLWILPLSGDRKPFAFLNTDVPERYGQFSPDGRWIAYSAVTAVNEQVYVRPFSPESGSAASPADPQWMIANEGTAPRWSSNGKRLYYIAPRGVLMAVDVQGGTSLQSGAPLRLFGDVPAARSWDVTGDGRFLFEMTSAPTGPPPPFTVVLNWQAGLKK